MIISFSPRDIDSAAANFRIFPRELSKLFAANIVVWFAEKQMNPPEQKCPFDTRACLDNATRLLCAFPKKALPRIPQARPSPSEPTPISTHQHPPTPASTNQIGTP